MTVVDSVPHAYGYPTPGLQSPSAQQITDNAFFLSQAEWQKANDRPDFDYVIVGSGFCALAFLDTVLQRNPHAKILLIERGPFLIPEHFQNLPFAFTKILGETSETYPWTLSRQTAANSTGHIRWQHGMEPYFGGRSMLWSAWCPRPTQQEMLGWPDHTIAAARDHFQSAEALLGVQGADQVGADLHPLLKKLHLKQRPVYGPLQHTIDKLLQNASSVPGVYRAEPAALASVSSDPGIDFKKFATPGPILRHIVRQQSLSMRGKGAPLHVITNCTVEKIIEQNGRATALQTSRGKCNLGDAKLILASGTLPATTLVQNSFKSVPNVGTRFSAHFITYMVARIPKTIFDHNDSFNDIEMGAFYIAGTAGDFSQQYHIQMTALYNRNPENTADQAIRCMPDAFATAPLLQMDPCLDHVILVCSVLGELDSSNKRNTFLENPSDTDVTTNSILHATENENDYRTWQAMDDATFDILETVIAPDASHVEYWHSNAGAWTSQRLTERERRTDGMVHESSTLYIGEQESAPVALDYKLRGSENVYVTGGGLWPKGGSWNPTMTMMALAQDLAEKLVEKE